MATIWLTKKELASISGYSYRRLHDIDAGLPANGKLFVAGENGKYDLALFVQRWVRYNIDAETAEAAKNAACQLDGALSRAISRIYNALMDMAARFYAVVDYPDEDIDPFTARQLGDSLTAQRTALAQLMASYDRGRLVKNGIPCAIVGARIYYVLFYLDNFKNSDGSFSWSKAIAIWDGGLAIYGGVIAVVIVAIILCRSRHIKLGAMMDLVVMGLLIGQAIGRWGNFLNREAFGAETTMPWRMQLTTTAGELVEVHPTFLYESLWNLIGLLLIVFVISKARRFDGENTCFYFLWYGVGRFWIEGLRTDSLYLFNWTIAGQPIRVSQALSVVMVLVSLFMLIWNLKVHPHKPEELYVNQVAARNRAKQNEKVQEE